MSAVSPPNLDTSYYWGGVNGDGSVDYNYTNSNYGVAPELCIRRIPNYYAKWN